MYSIVPATAELVQRFAGEQPPMTARMIAVVSGDEVLGLGGYYVNAGRQVVFCNISDGARADIKKHARALIAASRKVLAMTRPDMPVNALAQDNIDAAGRFLEHLGFEQSEGVYQWHKQ